MGDDPGHGVAAGVVVAEDLREEAPGGRDRVEDAVAVADAVLVEDMADAGFGQDVGEREAVVAHEAVAELIEAQRGDGVGVAVWDDRDGVGRADSLSDHTLYYDDRFSDARFAGQS